MPVLNMFTSFVEDKVKEINAVGSVVDVNADFNLDLNVHSMRLNQTRVFNKYRHIQYFIMNEPPGSGKSTTIKFVMGDKLYRDKNHKVVISIPQTLISKSFGRIILEFPDGKQIEWDIGNNLCQSTKYKKRDQLMDFLQKKKFSKGIYNRILITTHLSLALSCDKIKRIGNRFQNTTLIIDEAHHILYPENGSRESANKIGNLIHMIMQKNDPSTSIWLATATFFRGDKGAIIDEESLSIFEKYFLPLDQHWRENIQHIKSFEFNFVLYKNKIINDIVALLQDKKKTIVFCPYIGQILQNSHKLKFKNQLTRAIKRFWPNCNIIDLVDIDGRDERKKIIFNNKTAKDIDIILAVKIFDEGSDWIYAEQVLDVVPSNSLRIQVQRVGRVWRDLIGKTHISYYAFLPQQANFKSNEHRRKHLSNSYNAFVASMLLHDSIQPIRYPSAQYRKQNPLELIIPDEAKRQKIILSTIRELLKFRATIDDPTPAQTKDIIKKSLRRHNITDPNDDVIICIGQMLRRAITPPQPRPNWKRQTKDVSWMSDEGYDKIFDKDIYDGLLVLGTKTCDISSFVEFRRVYTKRRNVDQWVKHAEDLEERLGILPAPTSLIKKGLAGLVAMMGKCPEEFKHITQDSKQKTIDEWVEVAEQLANEQYNGMLPNSRALQLDGFGRVAQLVTSYPDKFQHIGQLKLKPAPIATVKWVQVAEKLQAENKGELPGYKWLKDNKYTALYQQVKTHPDKFKHINHNFKINSRKRAEEHLNDARWLMKRNGGKLPTSAWLQGNGYNGLYLYMKRHPELFGDVKKNNFYKPITYYVDLAETLSKKNGGIIPNKNQLEKAGYSSLHRTIMLHPEKFKGMKRHFGITNLIQTIGVDDET